MENGEIEQDYMIGDDQFRRSLQPFGRCRASPLPTQVDLKSGTARMPEIERGRAIRGGSATARW
jgi:hypothetical protein